MASREHQGLQIAVILLVMVTILLAVLTFVFYRKSDERFNEVATARDQMQTLTQERDAALFKVQNLKYMITEGGKTWTDMEADLDNIPSDPEMDQLRSAFEQDMLLFGAADEQSDAV